MPVMEAFLRMLRERHGSIVAYLSAAGVDQAILDALRTRLLTT
jgi:hypothetical protein